MSGGETPTGAAKGKQSDTQALCHPPSPPLPRCMHSLGNGAQATIPPMDDGRSVLQSTKGRLSEHCVWDTLRCRRRQCLGSFVRVLLLFC